MVDWLVQVQASGQPAAPPEEMMTEAPSAFARAISGSVKESPPTGRVVPQMSLHPLPMTNPAVNALTPCWVIAVSSIDSCELDMSVYGAKAVVAAGRTVAEAGVPVAAAAATTAAAASVRLSAVRRPVVPGRGVVEVRRRIILSFR